MKLYDDRKFWWQKSLMMEIIDGRNFSFSSFVNVEPDPVEQCNIMRKIHCGIGTEKMSKAPSGYQRWDKTGSLISSRWYFPWIYLRVCEMIKYYPQCQSMNTSHLHKAWNVLQLIPVPMKCWSMMGVNFIGPLKRLMDLITLSNL